MTSCFPSCLCPWALFFKSPQDPQEGMLTPQTSSDSPIRILPLDIFRLIFQIVYQLSTSTQRRNTSISLSHVSSGWRRVALDLVTLWRDISWGISSSNHLEFLQVQLRRTKAAPIHLEIYLFASDPTVQSGQLTEIIRPHMSRCRSLSLSADGVHIIDLLRSISESPSVSYPVISSDPLPEDQILWASLERLCINYSPRGWGHVNIPDPDPAFRLQTDAFDVPGTFAPRLKEVSLQGVRALCALRQHLPSITSLNIDAITPDCPMEQCTSLVKLTLKGNNVTRDRLPLDIPSLRELNWIVQVGRVAYDPQQLLSSRSWVGLTYINLQPMSSLFMARILSETPNVRCLIVHILSDTAAQPHPPHPTLPRLLELQCRCSIRDRFSPSPFLDLLTTPRLRCLTFSHVASGIFVHEFTEQVWRLLHRSQPPLLRLSVNGSAHGLHISDTALMLNNFGRHIDPQLLLDQSSYHTDDDDTVILIQDELVRLQLVHLDPCSEELKSKLDRILVARGGSFCTDEGDVMKGIRRLD